jgi:hypothetical protein
MNYELIKSNLKNCPTIYYISSEKFKSRQCNIETLFKNLNLNYVPVVISEKEDLETKYIYSEKFEQEKQAIYTTISHLKAIEKWLNSSKEEIGLFFEDDISFETVEYWNFNITDFLNKLPTGWEAIQLQIVSENIKNVSLNYFEERSWNDWAVGAYLIKREYAEKIIKNHKKENYYDLNLPEPYSNIQPLIENIIYSFGKVYKFPLFIENLNEPTTFVKNNHYYINKQLEFKNNIGQKLHHYSSANYVLNLWKTSTKNYMLA